MYTYYKLQEKLGVVVMVIHDLSDAFLSSARAYGDLKNSRKILVYLTFSSVQISWLYARIFVFPQCIIQQSYNKMYEFEPVIWYTPYHHKYRDLIATPYKF